MPVSVRTLCFPILLLTLASTPVFAANRGLPACNRRVLTRNGLNIRIGLDSLTKKLNDQLNAAHTHFIDLQLATQGNDLKVSGKRDGAPISIQGPVTATAGGQVQLHANQIHKNGMEVEGIMSLFGKDLADYVNLKQTQAMSVHGDDLVIYPDKLLGLHGHAVKVQLHSSSVAIGFASQPCR